MRRLELFTALSAADTDIEQVVSIVTADPALSYRVLQATNSAAMGLARKVSSIREAATVLGSDRIRQWVVLLMASDVAGRVAGAAGRRADPGPAVPAGRAARRRPDRRGVHGRPAVRRRRTGGRADRGAGAAAAGDAGDRRRADRRPRAGWGGCWRWCGRTSTPTCRRWPARRCRRPSWRARTCPRSAGPTGMAGMAGMADPPPRPARADLQCGGTPPDVYLQSGTASGSGPGRGGGAGRPPRPWPSGT